MQKNQLIIILILSITVQYTLAATKCDILSASNVVTTDGTYRTFTANGCPGFKWTDQTTPNTAYTQDFVYKYPQYPQVSTTKIYLGIYDATGAKNSNPVMGVIGLSYNGVGMYGNANAEGNDAWVLEAHTFDYCLGHVNGQQYHFHSEPNTTLCGYNQVAGKHSPLVAVMADGIPMFGQLGDNGVAPTNLDACGGHVDTTYPFYHYHTPANRASPYTLTCLSGCIYSDNGNNQLTKYVTTNSTCVKSATQYDYSALSSVYTNYVTTTGPITTSTSSSTSTGASSSTGSTSSSSSSTGSTSTGSSTTTTTTTGGSVTTTVKSTSAQYLFICQSLIVMGLFAIFNF